MMYYVCTSKTPAENIFVGLTMYFILSLEITVQKKWIQSYFYTGLIDAKAIYIGCSDEPKPSWLEP